MGCNTSKEANVQPPPVENGGAGGAEAGGRGCKANAVESANHEEEARKRKQGAEGGCPGADSEAKEEEEAAVKIQAVFRGHQVRKQAAQGKDEGDAEAEKERAAAAAEKEAMEAEFNPEDEELCHAATKIQASFRGHLARKQVVGKVGKGEEELCKEMEKMGAKGEEELDDELADIDLNDPELNKAATKIQASFRGHRVRKGNDEDEKEDEGCKGKGQ